MRSLWTVGPAGVSGPRGRSGREPHHEAVQAAAGDHVLPLSEPDDLPCLFRQPAPEQETLAACDGATFRWVWWLSDPFCALLVFVMFHWSVVGGGRRILWYTSLTLTSSGKMVGLPFQHLKGGRGFLMPTPCLVSQGCQFDPNCQYLLFSSSA